MCRSYDDGGEEDGGDDLLMVPGKSTLLELLALRLTAGKVDRGEYYIGGRARM